MHANQTTGSSHNKLTHTHTRTKGSGHPRIAGHTLASHLAPPPPKAKAAIAAQGRVANSDYALAFLGAFCTASFGSALFSTFRCFSFLTGLY